MIYSNQRPGERPQTPRVPEIDPGKEHPQPKLPPEKPGVAPKEKPDKPYKPEIKPGKNYFNSSGINSTPLAVK